MAWHRLEHKRTGEVQVVASLDGYDMKDWKAVPVKANRAPGDFQVIDADGSMRTDDEAKAKAAELALPEDERVALYVRRELAKLVDAGVITLVDPKALPNADR
jgi:hypothetical protein